MPIVLAAALAAAVAFVASLLGALTVRGAAAAALVGTAILWPAGWAGFAVLGAYFVTTTLVSRIATAAAPLTDQADRERRDARQVLANGGAAALGALAGLAVSGSGIWLVTLALAAAAADTWATAFGSLSSRPPRDLLRLTPVAPGTSGGVTWFGTSGGFVGAAVVGLVGTVVTGSETIFLAAAAVGGLAMLVDSALGSAVQAGYRCAACDRGTERPIHDCGAATTLTKGVRWIDNDLVNVASTAFALLAGVLLWWAGLR